MSLAKMMLMGRLGADAEYKVTRTGHPMLKMRLATSDWSKDDNGEFSERTTWHSAVCYGKLADRYQKMLRKGQMIYVEGPLRSNKWTGQDGQERTFWEVHVRNLEFCERKDSQPQNYQSGAPPAQARMYTPEESSAHKGLIHTHDSFAEDEIPF